MKMKSLRGLDINESLHVLFLTSTVCMTWSLVNGAARLNSRVCCCNALYVYEYPNSQTTLTHAYIHAKGINSQLIAFRDIRS